MISPLAKPRDSAADSETAPAPDTLSAQPGAPDLFAVGRRAAGRARAHGGGRAIFARSRQLLASGAWKGPRDAALSFVEEEDLPSLGGFGAAVAAGVRTLVASSAARAREAAAAGVQVLWRLPFRAGEPTEVRRARLDALIALIESESDLVVAGVIPTPEGEPMGLDTLAVFAEARLALPVPHLVADFVRLGHRLAQMALGFGASELWGPIMPERALRLGANAHNPVMTRKEAATLIRGAGLLAAERTGSGALEDVET
jgi:hypothetical protein